MLDITVEDILAQIAKLPPTEQLRLRHLLEQQQQESQNHPNHLRTGASRPFLCRTVGVKCSGLLHMRVSMLGSGWHSMATDCLRMVRSTRKSGLLPKRQECICRWSRLLKTLTESMPVSEDGHPTHFC